MTGCLNRPCRCGEAGPEAFGWYRYTQTNGSEGRRRDSRCKQCRRDARMVRYRADPEQQRAGSQAWKDANRAHVNQYNAARQQTEHHRALKAKSQRARKARMRAGIEGPEDPRILVVYQEAKDLERKLRACVACDDDLELQVHVDHIIPLSKGGKHVFENLQILSGRENLAKGAR